MLCPTSIGETTPKKNYETPRCTLRPPHHPCRSRCTSDRRNAVTTADRIFACTLFHVLLAEKVPRCGWLRSVFCASSAVWLSRHKHALHALHALLAYLYGLEILVPSYFAVTGLELSHVSLVYFEGNLCRIAGRQVDVLN